jgi:hypothetical protein
MPPRWRIAFLAAAFVSLAGGVAGGLARLSPLEVAPTAIALHGALMVSAFLGSVIGLERAAALERLWVYAAPLASSLGGAALLAGFVGPGLALLVLGAALLLAANLVVLKRHASLETTTLAAGAAAWLAGNASLFHGLDASAWWIAFFALTIGAERLELSRYLKRGAAARGSFAALVLGLLVTPLRERALGVVLVALALWLFRFDLARITVRHSGLPRYVALCLLAGYFWLAVGGALAATGASRDGALHAVFVGFVFSMVFGHAPIILPAVLRAAFAYHPVLYAPLALLHASLALRVAGVVTPGAWGNAVAIALFIVTAATLTLGPRIGRAMRPRLDRRQGEDRACR